MNDGRRFPLIAIIVAATGSLFPLLSANAASCQVESPAQTVALVELFTSEGCSSCPPADRWLGELGHRFTAQQLLPLALHVDYWDYIGWTDVFAQAGFSERQRRLSQLSSADTIYTPEIFVGMKELRGWNRDEHLASRVQAINRQPARAEIALQMNSTNLTSTKIQVHFSLDLKEIGRMAQGRVLVYENGLSTTVRAGENKGARLNHDHVVRFWSAPIPIDRKTGTAEWQRLLPLPADWKPENLGVGAFVEDAEAGEVLQAVSLPGCV